MHTEAVVQIFAPVAQQNLATWDIAESGDWSSDNAAGRQRAEEVLAHMRAKGTPLLLGHVMKAIVTAGRWGGVEVGFCTTISEATL